MNHYKVWEEYKEGEARTYEALTVNEAFEKWLDDYDVTTICSPLTPNVFVQNLKTGRGTQFVGTRTPLN